MTISGSSSSLVVPMVMWGRHPPVHCISAIYLLRDQKTLVSGSSDGQVFLWEVNAQSDKWEMTPRHVLVGHTSPIKCIAKASGGADGHHIVTSSENGEMFCWDTEDGRCIENKKLSTLIHTHIQPIDLQTLTPVQQLAQTLQILVSNYFVVDFIQK